MKVRSTTEWTMRSGKRRVVRLYKAWRNIKGRVQGHNVNGQGVAAWEGLENEFSSWQHFREWSLANGFSRRNNSCDRIRSTEPYSPNNCQWISVADNTRRANETGALNRAILAFQQSPITDSEQSEMIEFDRLCLGIYT